jgi:hypothetical protein
VSERTWGFNSPHPHECGGRSVSAKSADLSALVISAAGPSPANPRCGITLRASVTVKAPLPSVGTTTLWTLLTPTFGGANHVVDTAHPYLRWGQPCCRHCSPLPRWANYVVGSALRSRPLRSDLRSGAATIFGRSDRPFLFIGTGTVVGSGSRSLDAGWRGMLAKAALLGKSCSLRRRGGVLSGMGRLMGESGRRTGKVASEFWPLDAGVSCREQQ